MSRKLASQLFYSLLLALALSVALAAQSSKATEDLPAGQVQTKAIASCQECHEARIILQQRLNKTAWTKEVDKMIKWGAVVDASDRDALIDYLTTNFGVDQPPYVPLRTSVGKNTSSTAENRRRQK